MLYHITNTGPIWISHKYLNTRIRVKAGLGNSRALLSRQLHSPVVQVAAKRPDEAERECGDDFAGVAGCQAGALPAGAERAERRALLLLHHLHRVVLILTQDVPGTRGGHRLVKYDVCTTRPKHAGSWENTST